jgi:hypothetical protein
MRKTARRATSVVAANRWTNERRSMADDAAAAEAHMPALPANFTVKDEPSAAPVEADARFRHPLRETGS